MINFAIDFDDTFTKCPKEWSRFIKDTQDTSSWYMVTCRKNSNENFEYMKKVQNENSCDIPIIFCNLKSKYDTIKNLGIRIDIWIDDSPYSIIHGHD